MSIFAQRLKRHCVGRTECSRVRERQVEVVEEERPPAGPCRLGLGLLWEDEVPVGFGVASSRACGPAGVEFPEPEREDEDVQAPHVDAGAQELARLRLGAVDEQMNEPDDRCTVGRTDDPGDSEHDEAPADA